MLRLLAAQAVAAQAVTATLLIHHKQRVLA
jgi:hypothetical protein